MPKYFFELVRNRKAWSYSAVVIEAPNKKAARQAVKAYLDAHRPGPEQYCRWHLGEDAYGLEWHEEAFKFNEARISTTEPYDCEKHCDGEYLDYDVVEIVEGKPVAFDPDGQNVNIRHAEENDQ